MPASGSPIILQRRQYFAATLSVSRFSVHPQPDLRRNVRTSGYHGQPQFSTVRLRRNEVCRTRYCSANLKKPAFFTLAKPGCSYPTVSACFSRQRPAKKFRHERRRTSRRSCRPAAKPGREIGLAHPGAGQKVPVVPGVAPVQKFFPARLQQQTVLFRGAQQGFRNGHRPAFRHGPGRVYMPQTTVVQGREIGRASCRERV